MCNFFKVPFFCICQASYRCTFLSSLFFKKILQFILFHPAHDVAANANPERATQQPRSQRIIQINPFIPQPERKNRTNEQEQNIQKLQKRTCGFSARIITFFCFATLFFIIICYLVLLYYPRKRIYLQQAQAFPPLFSCIILLV